MLILWLKFPRSTDASCEKKSVIQPTPNKKKRIAATDWLISNSSLWRFLGLIDDCNKNSAPLAKESLQLETTINCRNDLGTRHQIYFKIVVFSLSFFMMARLHLIKRGVCLSIFLGNPYIPSTSSLSISIPSIHII